jgi:hypothetical protein
LRYKPKENKYLIEKKFFLIKIYLHTVLKVIFYLE